MKRLVCALMFCLLSSMHSVIAAPLNLSQTPLFLGASVAPMVMLVIGKDHTLYFPAYNNTSDVNNDGVIDTKFNPSITYVGYFDSNKCYTYTSTAPARFNPSSLVSSGSCGGSWNGNFLNYLTTTRLDALRKVLYGGKRTTDTTTATYLTRTNTPQDSHSWGMEYTNVATDGYDISKYTPYAIPTAGKKHLFVNVTRYLVNNNPTLRIALNQSYRIWDWIGIERPVADNRFVNGATGPVIDSVTEFVVRVAVCVTSVGLESNCTLYPNGTYKPTGLLQQYGANNSVLFGLITGSYINNLAGGVLRKNIGSITDEINPSTGILTATVGIIATLDRLSVPDFGSFTMPNGNVRDYVYACFEISNPLENGYCNEWGNPVAQMMYEALRYFAGKSSPTSLFDYGSTGYDIDLGLPKPTWVNPYATYPYCSQANMLVISDPAPTYDSTLVPGSYFGGGIASDLTPALNASSLGQIIFNGEFGSTIKAVISQSGTNNDLAPTAKDITSFGNLRGLGVLSNSQGSYNSAAVAYHGWTNDINAASGIQNVKTSIVAMPMQIPEISFMVGGKKVSIYPYSRAIYRMARPTEISPLKGDFQAVCQISSFFIESLTPTSGVFSVAFDDKEAGGDFDMDTIVKYTVTVNPGNTITVTMTTQYSAGAILQHLGYTISGTTHDGLYMDVRSIYNGTSTSDINYYLDTPNGEYPGSANWQTGVELPITSTRTFFPSNTDTVVTLKTPLWYAAKWGGFTNTNNTNLPASTSTWDANNDGTPDNYYLATNANDLGVQLGAAIQKILDKAGSFTATSLNSGYLSTGTRVYQALFQTKDWSGQLLSFSLNPANGDIKIDGSGPQGSLWDASTLLTNTGRQVITYKPSNKTGIAFRWPANSASPTSTELDAIQVTGLNTNPVTGTADTNGNTRTTYLRGNRTQEVQNGGTYRNRSNLLGDIINSNPISISVSEQEYPSSWPTGSAENSVPYSTFKTTNRTRQNVVYVGANDGMLHAFNGTTGVELFAYVPSAVYKNLSKLTNPNYVHQYYVDGSPTVVDAFYSGAWHTMLVGGLGGGGQGIYALDVTNPAQFSEANAASIVKWEFTDGNDADLGYTYSQPQIIRLNTGQWAAVFGNGYNNTFSDTNTSTTGNAAIYIVDIATGTLIKKFDTQVGTSADPLATARPNGMSTVAVVDTNHDSIADTIYAGDLFGNLWKIDISATSAASWNFTNIVGGKPAPFFVAIGPTNKRQAITTQPIISRVTGNASAFQIYFGTGKYLESTDLTDLNVQTVYSLIDTGLTSISGRSVLQQQTILAETGTTRITSSNPLAGTAKGWYMDLIYNNVAKGERSITHMTYVNKKLVFSTVIPSSDPCAYGGESWLMEINAADGNSLNYSVLDANNDGVINDQDMGSYVSGSQTITKVVSGLKSTVGLIAAPTILNAGEKEYKYMRGTSGNVQKVVENPGEQIYNRQSWKQLR